MGKLNDFLENSVMPLAGRIAAQRHLQALRDGIVLTMPLIIIGSVFLILSNLPIPGYDAFMAEHFGGQWAEKLSYPVGVTFDIMALIAAFGIAYRLAEKYAVDALSAGVISVAAFLLATPFKVPFTPQGAKKRFSSMAGFRHHCWEAKDCSWRCWLPSCPPKFIVGLFKRRFSLNCPMESRLL